MRLHVKLHHLEYFVAVGEELNFGRAAERLHISQPPLSRQIKELEDYLGVSLFHRTKQKVELTPAGRAFLAEAYATLERAEQAVLVARGGAGGELRVGLSTAFDMGLVPQIGVAFGRRSPKTRVLQTSTVSSGLLAAVRRREMDAAFVTIPTSAEGITIEPLYRETFVVAIAAHHRLADQIRVRVQQLNGERFMWFHRDVNPFFYDYCMNAFRTAGFTEQPIYEFISHHVTLAMIADGLGVTLVQSALRKITREGVVFRELEEIPGFEHGIGIAYRSGDKSPDLHAYIAAAREAAAGSWPEYGRSKPGRETASTGYAASGGAHLDAAQRPPKARPALLKSGRRSAGGAG